MSKPPAAVANPADRVVRVRLREPIRFPDLTERRTLKLSAIPDYAARAHFGTWQRRLGRPNFEEFTGVFTPLFFVDIETADVALDAHAALQVRGATFLAKTIDRAGNIDHLVREGQHVVLLREGNLDTIVARARLINVFTRHGADPAHRRVTELPADMGLGPAPSRVIELPTVETLLPHTLPPDFNETATPVWHYGQTDPNRHVNGIEYLRMMEVFVADSLRQRGHDFRRLYFARARIVYRKPSFRGEGYRRVAWYRGGTPLVVSGAFFKEGDPPDARPAVAVELTLSQHDDR
jgi:hypothetical protein